jgi:hypothetical protein
MLFTDLTCTDRDQPKQRLGPLVAKSDTRWSRTNGALTASTGAIWALVVGLESMVGESLPRFAIVFDLSASQPWGSFTTHDLNSRSAGAPGSLKGPYTLPYRFVTGEAGRGWFGHRQGGQAP